MKFLCKTTPRVYILKGLIYINNLYSS
jgi:hypothetical protein